MSNLLIVLFIIGVVAGVGLTIILLLPFLKKKGVKVGEIMQRADIVLSGADNAIDVINKIIPNSPTSKVLSVIDKYAHVGVNCAEQLYTASELKADERNDKAKDIIYSALKLAGIEKTPEIENIVNGAIEAEVLALGHKTLEHKTPDEKQIAADKETMQQNINSLQTDKSNLQNENTQLKEKLSNIAESAKVA